VTRDWLLLALGLGACGTTSSPPKEALHSYLQDSARGNIDAAYQRLSPSFRQRCDKACFGRLLDAQPGQSQKLLDELRSAEPSTVYSAEAKLASGVVLRLEQEPTVPGEPRPRRTAPPAFTFESNPLDFYPQDTPARTLRSFARAFAAKRHDVLQRFVPKSFQDTLTADGLRERFAREPKLAGQVETLRRHLDEPVTVDGNIARLPLGPEQEATLLLEDGRWRVQKLE
jgi:hypothetical protein